MWEYKIIKSDLGFNIYRKKEENGMISVWFLNWNGKWTLNKSYAKTFYHKEDALSALTLMKVKDGKDTD